MIRSFTKSGITCTDTVYETVRIRTAPHAVLAVIPDQCAGNPPLNLDLYVDKAHFGGTWYLPGKPSVVVANYLYPKFLTRNDSLPYVAYLHYVFKDVFGCAGDDSIKLTVFQKPAAGPDITVYKHCGPYILNNSQVPAKGGQWTAIAFTPSNAIIYSGDTAFFYPDGLTDGGIYPVLFTYKAKTGSAACDGTDTLLIEVKEKPHLSASQYDTLCGDVQYTYLNASPGGGTWKFRDSTNPGALVRLGSQLVFAPKIAGPGWHKLRYIFKYGIPVTQCSDSVDADVYVTTGVNSDFTTADSLWGYCLNRDVRLIPRLSGGSFTGRGIVMNGNEAHVNALLQDSNRITVTYSLSYLNGKCVSKTSHSINFDFPPTLKFRTDTVMCANDNVFSLTAIFRNASSVQWKSVYNGQDGGIFINPSLKDTIASVDYIPGADQLKAKKFTVFVTGVGFGWCDSVQAKITIHIKPGPQPDFVSQREGCEPFTTFFKDNSYDSTGKINKYEWDFSDLTGLIYAKNPAHTFTTHNGDSIEFYDIKLKVYSDEGCSKTILKPNWIIVHAQPRPVIKAIPTFTTFDRPTIRFGLSNQSRNCDTTNSSAKYEWHFGDCNNPDQGGHSNLKNPQYAYSDTGFYTVVLKVTNAWGCEGSDSEINLVDIRPAFAIFIPNVFLPGTIKGGGTHINKIFRPVVSSCSHFNMTIFNRWGELLFATSDPDKGWDGTSKGITIPEGVYIYYIRATNLRGEPFEYKGTITVIW
jgi:gliding motility-associated-like protein